MFCGDACELTRQRYKRLTALYQSVGTKSAMRHVRKLAGREASFKKDVNHNISKQLVSSAKGTGRGLALEELTHIPRPAPATKDQNDASCKWAFRQLRSFIAYKARLAGVPVTIVDPAYTSQKCSVCGQVDEDNRRSQASFACLRCGHAENADVNASRNIRDLARAAVDRPMVVRHAEVSA
jgi:IS605 OrfB family transposase